MAKYNTIMYSSVAEKSIELLNLSIARNDACFTDSIMLYSSRMFISHIFTENAEEYAFSIVTPNRIYIYPRSYQQPDRHSIERTVTENCCQ